MTRAIQPDMAVRSRQGDMLLLVEIKAVHSPPERLLEACKEQLVRYMREAETRWGLLVTPATIDVVQVSDDKDRTVRLQLATEDTLLQYSTQPKFFGESWPKVDHQYLSALLYAWLLHLTGTGATTAPAADELARIGLLPMLREGVVLVEPQLATAQTT